ncbi:hypothetical protein CathTA2_0460 [Caldalkalibacillus thermarum TA2.A1]|uniref:Cytochrome c biogenesis protein transmembrane region n=1 Tax=Caldalkalibacillus thermarum (strain TA2.A1) TaxID=986075 RepID=F5L3U8_CALTT|nr:hypothetical protein CathTA2_0460 [Caldalkalibacillus thermarum TA2.A1]
MPVLLFLGLAYGLGIDKTFVKKSRTLGKIVQIIAGVILVVIGLHDTILYWQLGSLV